MINHCCGLVWGKKMPDTKATLLIVDDEETIRTSLSQIFTEFGHRVRSAADGLTALSEMKQQAPDILLSDLNMPGLSGFELLYLVRRQFPAIRVVAMSSAFKGNEVPSGVAADAFYHKGCSVAALFRIIETLPLPERMFASSPKYGDSEPDLEDRASTSGGAYITIASAEC